MNPVLVDTSVWVDHFKRHNEALTELLHTRIALTRQRRRIHQPYIVHLMQAGVQISSVRSIDNPMFTPHRYAVTQKWICMETFMRGA